MNPLRNQGISHIPGQEGAEISRSSVKEMVEAVTVHSRDNVLFR
jgi:hypothetical protein